MASGGACGALKEKTRKNKFERSISGELLGTLFTGKRRTSALPTTPGAGPPESAEIRAEHFFSILFRARNHAAEIFHNFLFQKTTT